VKNTSPCRNARNIFRASSPSALCEALGFCFSPISSDNADGFLKHSKRGG
jgi:hypothetical protein